MSNILRNKKRVLFLTQFSMLLAIEALVCFTPLGSIPFTSTIVATLAHVPVIITAILLGIRAGAAMGFAAGLFSFLVWTFMPPATSAMFAFVFTPFYSIGDVSGNMWSLVICFVPRILIGVAAGASFKFFSKVFSKFDRTKILTYALSGILGSLANTVLVLGGIYVFFGRVYAQVLGMPYELLLGGLMTVVLTNGLLEAVIGAITGYAVCRPIRKLLKLE